MILTFFDKPKRVLTGTPLYIVLIFAPHWYKLGRFNAPKLWPNVSFPLRIITHMCIRPETQQQTRWRKRSQESDCRAEFTREYQKVESTLPGDAVNLCKAPIHLSLPCSSSFKVPSLLLWIIFCQFSPSSTLNNSPVCNPSLWMFV